MLNYYKKAAEPFYFCTRLNLSELTEFTASNITELVNVIKTIPGAAIFYHTHMFLEQPRPFILENSNDFAYWVKNVLGENRLGEELASIDIMEFGTIRALREKIISVIEKNIFERKESFRQAPPGMEFHFIKSRSFILPTPFMAKNLAEFINALKAVPMGAIYFHLFEARLRLEKGTNDFSYWIDTSLANPELAQKLSDIDLYTHTLEGLRRTIIKKLSQN